MDFSLGSKSTIDPGELRVREIIREGEGGEGMIIDETITVSSEEEVEHGDDVLTRELVIFF